ncbi:TonB-dependent receptor family protein [Ramlibacter alkalitolerans]|uniref:TonB-dependent receptor n=1 Tax=Ramlibacter alkalitolerans TaxID=2039631 RepID=A0ABS1JNC6_9BURK|nr:TonB-dependent receptor [Ramlibacter alkalitolerans]MBL0425752.1 TonB-dependent receptor [Ramlibacter alkalitolerans]
MKKTLLAAAACATLQAHAQTPADVPPAQQAERTLRPVVVTATPGVAQQAFDTAASIDVIDGATIRNSQLQVNMSESLVRVPGVIALNRQNYAQDLQISVRGFGARSTFGVRGLRLYSDGIPATAPDGQGQVSHFDLSSADRIEVLRGPFSALYGNSSGGVISIFTADGLPGMQAEGGAAVGSDGIRRVNARFAGDNGTWNWNVGATRFETDGFRDHSAAKREGLNGKLKWKGSADTRVTLVANAVDMPDVQDPLGLTRPEFQANPRQASPVALLFDTRKSVEQQQVGLIVEHQLNPANGLKLTTWRGQRSTEQFQAIPVGTQTPITQPGGVIDLDRDYMGLDGQWIHKSRLAGSPLTFTAGVYADELKEHRQGFQNFTGASASPTALGVIGALRRDEDNRVRSFDQYAQANWERERFGLTLGVRHSTVRFRSQDHFIVGANGDDSGAAKYSATTPMAGLVYHVNDNLNVYASVGRGFETPTFNEVSYRPNGQTGLNFDLKSAYSRHYEVGVKAEPVRNWRVNAALFQANTSDEIVVLTNQGGRSTFQNASSTRRRGLEAALAGSWAQAWSTYAALTWLDASYRTAFLTCPGGPCPTAANPAVPVPAGNRIPGIPRASAFAELVYKHRPWGLEAGIEVRYTGRIAVDDRNTDFAPAATLFNLRLALAQNVQRWTVREFVRVDNLAGRDYIGSVIVNEGNSRFFEPAPGRTWLLGVSAAYAF